MRYKVRPFGQGMDEIWIENDQTQIAFSNLGARINRWNVRNDHGEWESIILGFDNTDHALEGKGYYYGVTAGPVAGRISRGQYDYQGQTVQLAANEGLNHLHGGDNSIDVKAWSYQIVESDSEIQLKFQLTLLDQYNGYPGPITMEVVHTYDEANCWSVSFRGQTEQATVFNPTNHVYFNLNGNNAADIMNHRLRIAADQYAPVQADGTPVGWLQSVVGTPFDLREGALLGALLKDSHPQLQLKKGFDHPFVLTTGEASLEVREKGLRIAMATDQPSVVVYTHYFTNPSLKIWGQPLQPYAGLTLETQILPDAVNHEGFGNIILEPGQTFESKTQYKLLIEK